MKLLEMWRFCSLFGSQEPPVCAQLRAANKMMRLRNSILFIAGVTSSHVLTVGDLDRDQIFYLKADSATLICFNGAPACMHVLLSACYARRMYESEQQIRPSNSRSLQRHDSDTRQQSRELLTQFALLGHKNSGMLQ